MDWRRKWQPTPVFLPGESQGWGSMVGCHLWGHTELDTNSRSRGVKIFFKKMIKVKIYLGLSLVLLWTVWGQFIFRYFLDPAYTSQDL